MTAPDDTPTKQCSKCGETKPLDAFRRRPERPCGYRSQCRDCEAAGNHARYWTDPEKSREKSRRSVAQWRAKDPEAARVSRVKWETANPDKIRAQRQRTYERHRAERADYRRLVQPKIRVRYATDPEFRNRQIEAGRRWRRANPDKVYDQVKRRHAHLKGAAVVERIDRFAIAERDGWTCHVCEKPIRKDLPGRHAEALSMDHLVPLSKGGDHTAANLRPAHRSCNSRRGAGRLPAQLRLPD